MKIVVPPLWDYNKHGPGNVVEWFKKEGEETGENDLLCQIMVVKSINNIYSTQAGVLTSILAPIGTEVKPGDVIAEVAESTTHEKPASGGPAELVARQVSRKVLATPSARRMAKEMGIALSSIKGTGKGGIVTGGDVMLASVPEKEGAPDGGYTVKPITGLRKAVSETMMKSLAGSAQLTLHTAADVTELVAMKEAWSEENGISYNDLICYFTVKALGNNMYLNAHIMGDREIREFRDINLGVSVQTEEGLYSVVVKNAGKMKLEKLKGRIGALVDKAHAGTLSVEDVTGSTFTVSNLGMAGIHQFTPIINPPEIAILGVGSIENTLVLNPGGIVQRKVIHLSLTIDHRAVDGLTASRFLSRLKEILGSPHEFI